ncbi:PFL family protein [Caldicellulosiruptor naganoensis]|uniref:UPF0210 protein OTJ99_000658 n=1 Tax=Caldicellulosiruptor naganoensis TaxID=29324 RepID=A0ABY7BI31_9FIRM|nr:PFL family protein [Caldicellulosiruptor naganoensis]WAM32150.1 PFL family protein [Caldicellulosiruptor naganoensis]
MFTSQEIIETINMVKQNNLDIRTITVGISLFDCVSENPQVFIDRMKKKIVEYAGSLKEVANEIEDMFGLPIVNRRVALTPISLLTYGFECNDLIKVAIAIDDIAKEIGVDLIGGYSALVHKSYDEKTKRFISSIPEALAETERLCSSVDVGTTKSGINLDVIGHLGYVIKEIAYKTKDKDSFGCARFVVFANATDDNPFMAGAFHGVGEGDSAINVGISGPGVIKRAVEEKQDASIEEIYETIKRMAFKITRAGQLVLKYASERLNIPMGIVDLSLAPTPKVGDSIAEILEEIGVEKVGGYGTTFALAILNDAVKKGGAMAASFTGGLSGAFIPVSEDSGMVKGVEEGALSLEKLEAMTSVCSVGLDMIVVPGDTEPEVISGLIADEIAIGVYNNKTTAVRIIPAYGKKEGDEVNFGGLLGRAKVMKINKFSPHKLIHRGGRVPPPIISLRN